MSDDSTTARISFGICPKCGQGIGGGSAVSVYYVNGRAFHPDCAPKPKNWVGAPNDS